MKNYFYKDKQKVKIPADHILIKTINNFDFRLKFLWDIRVHFKLLETLVLCDNWGDEVWTEVG